MNTSSIFISIFLVALSAVTVAATILTIKFEKTQNYFALEKARNTVAICVLIMFAYIILCSASISWR